MDDDQQFCLRWNNHQSTLVAVFDTLLENGTLVDCTLAAEGKCLNAHKVVLSACSPYFESLLSRHFDKHPILILKDVKFQELKAMMDYMYRGEVNISQDQLGALLKAAESLQIKGLSDNRKGEPERKPTPAPPPPKSPQQTSALPKVQGLTIEQRSRDDSREGSMSPGPRKKKRLRRKSEELDNHDASNSSESHSLPAQNIPSSLPAVSKINADVPEPVETKTDILRHKQPDDIPQVPIIKEKIETHTELMLEPKSEYVEEMNEDSIEDLTLDDDDLSNMEQMDDQAGPSHGNAGEGSSQGFGGWHMGNQSQDEVFLAAQEAVGAHRDSQEQDELIVNVEMQQIRENVIGIKKKINQNLDKLCKILSKINVVPSKRAVDPTVKEDLNQVFNFPLVSCEQIQALDNEIRNNSEFKLQLITFLSKTGGTSRVEDGGKVAYKIIDQMFDPSVLMNYTWTGITRLKNSRKMPFQTLEGILDVFFQVISLADCRHTKQKNCNIFKEGVLKHATKRSLRKRLGYNERRSVQNEEIDDTAKSETGMHKNEQNVNAEACLVESDAADGEDSI